MKSRESTRQKSQKKGHGNMAGSATSHAAAAVKASTLASSLASSATAGKTTSSEGNTGGGQLRTEVGSAGAKGGRATGGAGNHEDRPQNEAPARAPQAAGTPDEIDRLATMTIGELQRLFVEVLGEKTRCPNRGYLVRRIMEAAVPMDTEGTPVEAGSQAPETLEALEVETPQGSCGTDAAHVPEDGPASELPAIVPVLTSGATVSRPGANSTAAAPSSDPALVDVDRALPAKLSKLDVPALQALYAEVVGRPSKSSNAAYLIWKIREVRRGRIPAGPRKNARADGATFKVLPLRMESELVDKLDAAWRRQGLASRMELFRRSLQAYLASVGEGDVAAVLADGN